jgi:hypothetical protein
VHITASDEGSFTVSLSRAELGLINNSLNEVCNGVSELDHDGEFATRLGQSRDEARRLLAEVRGALGPATELPVGPTSRLTSAEGPREF